MSINLMQSQVDNKNDLVIFLDQVATQVAFVPSNWRRVFVDGKIVYLTPSQKVLRSMDEVSNYLLSDGTCKCGLSCPFFLELFNFDPQVESVENAVDETKLNCKHRSNPPQANQTISASTSSNIVYQPKTIYTPTIQHTSDCNQTPNKMIVHSASNSDSSKQANFQLKANVANKTANYPITIQSTMKPVEQSNQLMGQKQILSYIPIRKDQLSGLSNIGQPIILQASQLKGQPTNSQQLIQFLNSSQLVKPMVIQQSRSHNSS